MRKTRMLVLAGGRSDEHEISLVSAGSLLKALEGSDIEATAVVITRKGEWLSPDDSQRAIKNGKTVAPGMSALRAAHIAESYDVVFPLLHGPWGEDGTIQGMLELGDIPYIGSGVLASSLCMDKVMAKDVMAHHKLPQVGYRLVRRREFKHNPEVIYTEIQKLNAPWFIKPANLGSSLGISKVMDKDGLEDALTKAFRFDRRVIVEESVEDARELEVAVLGNGAPEASVVGEITFDSEFYDYDTKYTDGEALLHIPADLPSNLSKRLQKTATKAFEILDCAGFARVDFFYQPKTKKLFINEVNTIPGFTPFSMFTKLWEESGVPYVDMVQRLVDLAIERHRE